MAQASVTRREWLDSTRLGIPSLRVDVLVDKNETISEPKVLLELTAMTPDRVPSSKVKVAISKRLGRATLNIHSILPSLALALAFAVPGVSVRAADEHPASDPKKTGTQTAPGGTVPKSPPDKLDMRDKKRIDHAHHLAIKSANTEFLKSPEGIFSKEQIESLDQEINAVYEKYLNISREDPASENGKKLREERDRQVKLLNQKRDKVQADYEKLKMNSSIYQGMVVKHLKSQLAQLRGKVKSEALEKAKMDDKK